MCGYILNWVAVNPLSFWKTRRMELAYTELDLRERSAAEDMFYAKVLVSEIAAAIGPAGAFIVIETRQI